MRLPFHFLVSLKYVIYFPHVSRDFLENKFLHHKDHNNKYMTKNFKEFLQKSHQEPMSAQGVALEAEIKQWAGDKEQTDDILVIGFSL